MLLLLKDRSNHQKGLVGLYAEILQRGGGGGRGGIWGIKKKRQGEHWKTMLKNKFGNFKGVGLTQGAG